MRKTQNVIIIASMNDESWRLRLSSAIQAEMDKGRSARQISVAAGLGPNYVNQFLKTGREPSIPHFLALASELNESPVRILTGIEVTPDDEELLRLYANLSDHGRERLLSLFRELQGI